MPRSITGTMSPRRLNTPARHGGVRNTRVIGGTGKVSRTSAIGSASSCARSSKHTRRSGPPGPGDTIRPRLPDVEVLFFRNRGRTAREPAQGVAREDLVRLAAGQPLAVQLADDRRHHEAVADEATREEEVGVAGRRAEDRVAVGRLVV